MPPLHSASEMRNSTPLVLCRSSSSVGSLPTAMKKFCVACYYILTAYYIASLWVRVTEVVCAALTTYLRPHNHPAHGTLVVMVWLCVRSYCLYRSTETISASGMKYVSAPYSAFADMTGWVIAGDEVFAYLCQKSNHHEIIPKSVCRCRCLAWRSAYGKCL